MNLLDLILTAVTTQTPIVYAPGLYVDETSVYCDSTKYDCNGTDIMLDISYP